MKNAFLLGVLFFSTAVFAESTATVQNTENTVSSLNGSADGYSVRGRDDLIDFGLVIPTLSKVQVMDFNLSYVLSSETSVIRAAGQRINVPSNLSLPKQRERYLFFNVRIDKPEFKLPITTAETPSEVVILEGRFPFGSTVDALRADQPLFSVINSFTFKSFSLSPVEDPEAPLSLTVGDSAIEGESVEFVSPIAADRDFVSVGLSMASSMNENGEVRHFPVDIKTLERPEFLKTDSASETTPIVVSIPTNVFDSATDASTKPFPFSMIWGEAAPEVSLPLAKTFITLDTELNQYEVAFEKITDVETLGMKATFLDAEGNKMMNSFTTGRLKSSSIVSVPEGAARARIDVYAIDVDPVMASIIVENALTEADILKEAKYITRYEEDLN